MKKDALEINKEYSEKFVQPGVKNCFLPEYLKKYLKEKSNVVDLGCGEGSMIYGLHKENKKLNIIGVDISPRRINQLQKSLPKDKFLCEDVCKTSIKSKSQDFVYTSQVIEHVYNDDEMLKEIKRILKKEGVVYISSVIKKPCSIYKYKNRHGKFCLDPTHEREYPSREYFLNLLTRNGFRILGGFYKPVKRNLMGLKIKIPGFYTIEVICKNEKN